MRYALELAYKGTEYYGFQSQEHGNSVQQALEFAIGRVIRDEISLVGCGRTDTGVHASYFVAHFDTEQILSDQFIFRVNHALPPDIAIHSARMVNGQFHARFKAFSRQYRYHIHRRKNPFLRETSWYRYGQLDVEAMNEASAFLLTVHDFESFSRVKTSVKTFNCQLTECFWKESGDQLVFQVRADRFLRNMVRAMVGTLIKVGTGEMSLNDLKEVMESRDRAKAGVSAPAQGLFLTDVKYKWEDFLIHE